jgi:hypothetical protein
MHICVLSYLSTPTNLVPDGQHLVSDALRVMKPVAEGKADFSVGSRLMGDTRQMPLVKKFGNFVLDFITAVFAHKYVSDSRAA